MESFTTMLREVREYEKKMGMKEVVLQESLPRADGKREPDAFQRLGLAFESYKAVAQPVTIDEAPKDARVVLPEGAHRKLLEALGDGTVIPEGIHAKLARAL